MAESSSARTFEARTAEAVARAGLITSITGAAIMALVLVGNLILISLRHVPPGWLGFIVQVGPPFVALIGFVGTASTWYGRWRILRGLASYDARDDIVDQALNTPGNLQNLPMHLGCVTLANPLLLALGLLLCLITFGPAPLDILGTARYGTNQPVITPTATSIVANAPTTTPTSVPTSTPPPTNPPATTAPANPTSVPPTKVAPTATKAPPTATPIPPTATPTVAFSVKPTSSTTTCIRSTGTAPDVTITLDNTGSTVAVDWLLSDTTTWGTPSSSAGNIPAGKTAQVTFTITNCPNIPVNGFDDENAKVTLTSGSQGSYPFTVRIIGYLG